jgi:hypothetical protein
VPSLFPLHVSPAPTRFAGKVMAARAPARVNHMDHGSLEVSQHDVTAQHRRRIVLANNDTNGWSCELHT